MKKKLTKPTPADAAFDAAGRTLQPGRRYKGSAMLSQAGDFLFTPYAEAGQGRNPWRLISQTQYATLRETAEVLQLRVTLPKHVSHQPYRTMREIAFAMLMH